MEQDDNKMSFRKLLLNSMSQLLVVIGAIIFFFAIYKSKEIFGFIKMICTILLPVILGIIFAYLMNPIVIFFERKLDELREMFNDRWQKEQSKKPEGRTSVEEQSGEKSSLPTVENTFGEKVTGKISQVIRDNKKEKVKKKKSMRFPAILISFLLVALIVYILAMMVIPQIYLNIRNVVYTLPGQMNQLYYKLLHRIQNDANASEILNKIYNESMEFITNWMKKDMLGQLSLLISGVVGVIGVIIDLFIGIIVAIYVLISKENFMRQFNKVIYAFLSDSKAEELKKILRESDRIFGGFISGKLIDSLIIGVICFFCAVLLKFPYAVLISVIVGITNVIPFFGPYIGAVPCAILILLDSPSKGVMFIIFIILLQQFDGNILGPKILGESTGLSPFWIIFSILLGSGLFGIVGMLFGVPVFGVIYYLVKSYINYRLDKKKKVVK